MATTTSTLGLTKPALTDNADIGVINTNMDLLDAAVAAKETPTGALTKATTAQSNAEAYTDTKTSAIAADYIRQPGYGVDTGTANHLLITLSPAPTSYVDGMGVAVKVKVASTTATDINVNGLGAKAIYDSLGNAVNNFRANTTYSLKYESVSGSFIAQGKGGGGNVTAPQLLLGVRATSDTGPITGTMPNNGVVAITPTGSSQTIVLGYHNGSGSVAGVTVPVANVLTGTTIAGQAGTMANHGAVVITPSNVSQAIAVGYHNGSGSVSAVTVPVANVLTGTTIAGQAGTMPENGALGNYVPSASPQTIPAGHTSGGTVAAVTVPAANILTGTTIAGTAGTMPNKTASATVITPSNTDQAVTAGYTDGALGSVKVAAVVVPAANVLTGTTIAGTAGSMPNNGAVVITPSGSAQAIAAGYHSGSGSVAAVVVPAASVLTGTTIAGTAGTYPTNPAGSTQSWTVAGTYSWTVPAGVTRVLVGLIGGGGGGGGGSTGNDMGGGGGGASRCAWASVTSGSTVSVTVGAGGYGGTSGNGVAGGAGGTSSFGAYSANGGSGSPGSGATHGTGGASSGSASPTIISYAGGDGGTGYNSGGGSSGGGGGGAAGGASGGSNGGTGLISTGGTSGPGGVMWPYAVLPSSNGGSGGVGGAAAAATAGNAPGGVGGGGKIGTAYPGGAGAAGRVQIQW